MGNEKLPSEFTTWPSFNLNKKSYFTAKEKGLHYDLKIEFKEKQNPQRLLSNNILPHLDKYASFKVVQFESSECQWS